MHIRFKEQAGLCRAPIDPNETLGYSRLNSSARRPWKSKREPSIKPLSGERLIYVNGVWADGLGEAP
jgi:hypothetical protein